MEVESDQSLVRVVGIEVRVSRQGGVKVKAPGPSEVRQETETSKGIRSRKRLYLSTLYTATTVRRRTTVVEKSQVDGTPDLDMKEGNFPSQYKVTHLLRVKQMGE